VAPPAPLLLRHRVTSAGQLFSFFFMKKIQCLLRDRCWPQPNGPCLNGGRCVQTQFAALDIKLKSRLIIINLAFAATAHPTATTLAASATSVSRQFNQQRLIN
jgi:hypothetical protein